MVVVNGIIEVVFIVDWFCFNFLGFYIILFDRWGKLMVKRGWGCLGFFSFSEYIVVFRFLVVVLVVIRLVLEKVFR